MLTALARPLGKSLKAAVHRPFAALSLPWRSRGDPPQPPLSLLSSDHSATPMRGLQISGKTTRPPPSPPPRGLEAARQGVKGSCQPCPWLAELQDASAKHRRAEGKTRRRVLGLSDGENGRGRCPGLLLPVPGKGQRTNTPQDEKRGVCSLFPSVSPVSRLLSSPAPGVLPRGPAPPYPRRTGRTAWGAARRAWCS